MSTPVNGQSPPSICLVVGHYSYYQCSSPLTFMEHLLHSRHFLKSFRWVVLLNPLNSPVRRTLISPILQVRELKPERSSDLLEAIHPVSGRAKPVRPQSPPLTTAVPTASESERTTKAGFQSCSTGSEETERTTEKLVLLLQETHVWSDLQNEVFHLYHSMFIPYPVFPLRI